MAKELDKYQLATARMASTVYGFFSGEHTAIINDNARAADELIKGVWRFYAKNNLIDEPNFKGNAELSRAFNQSSNFSKHADRDANQILAYSEMDMLPDLFEIVDNYISLTEALQKAGLLDLELMQKSVRVIEYDGVQHNIIPAVHIADLYHVWFFECLKSELSKEEHAEYALGIANDLLGRLNPDNVFSSPEQLIGAGDDLNELHEHFYSSQSGLSAAPGRNVKNAGTRKKYLDIILDNKLWPIGHDCGIALARGVDVEFKVKVIPRPEIKLIGLD